MPKLHLRRDEKRTHCGREITDRTTTNGKDEDPARFAFPNECYWCRITYESARRDRE